MFGNDVQELEQHPSPSYDIFGYGSNATAQSSFQTLRVVKCSLVFQPQLLPHHHANRNCKEFVVIAPLNPSNSSTISKTKSASCAIENNEPERFRSQMCRRSNVALMTCVSYTLSNFHKIFTIFVIQCTSTKSEHTTCYISS